MSPLIFCQEAALGVQVAALGLGLVEQRLALLPDVCPALLEPLNQSLGHDVSVSREAWETPGGEVPPGSVDVCEVGFARPQRGVRR